MEAATSGLQPLQQWTTERARPSKHAVLDSCTYRPPNTWSRDNNYVTNDKFQIRFRARQNFLVVELNTLLVISDCAQNIHLLRLGKLSRSTRLRKYLQNGLVAGQ